MKKFISIFFLLSFLAGCNSVSLQEKWFGETKQMLIALEGTPDDIISDGFGGEIYTYYTIGYYDGYYSPGGTIIGHSLTTIAAVQG